MEIESQQPVSAMALIDTGATVNIVDSATFQKIVPQPALRKPSISIYPYGENATKLPVLGTAMLTIAIPSTNETITAEFHVVNGNSGNLLSWRTAEKLNLVKVTCHVSTNQKPELIKNYESMFKGIGEIDGVKVKLHINEKVEPKQQRHRRIPFHIRKDVEKELQRLQDLDIIEKVEGPTPWVSPIVVVPKSTGVRICVDMRMANQAIQHERHPTPTIEDIVADLNGQTVFSTLDFNSGFHQFVLAEESLYIATFSSHKGLHRYKRLNFSVNAAPEIFQAAVTELLS